MRKMMNKVLVTILAAATVTFVAHAHRFWMLPSTFTLSGAEQWVTVDAAISNDLFFPNHVAMSLEDIIVTAPDGSRAEKHHGAEGKFRTTFDVKLDQQGTYRFTENGAAYFARWTENGKEQGTRTSLRKLSQYQDKEGVKFMKAARRVETYVTLGAPTKTVFGTTGKGIELVPVTHPNDLYTGEEAIFQLVVDGKPKPGLEVTIIKGHDRYRDQDRALKVKTDADGAFRFSVSEAGQYWLSTGAMAGLTKEEGLDLARYVSFAATLEVLPN